MSFLARFVAALAASIGTEYSPTAAVLRAALRSIRDLVANPAARRGPDNIPGANPAKCPILRATASNSLSGASPERRVVKPWKKPCPACLTASNKEKSPV